MQKSRDALCSSKLILSCIEAGVVVGGDVVIRGTDVIALDVATGKVDDVKLFEELFERVLVGLGVVLSKGNCVI